MALINQFAIISLISQNLIVDILHACARALFMHVQIINQSTPLLCAHVSLT